MHMSMEIGSVKNGELEAEGPLREDEAEERQDGA